MKSRFPIITLGSPAGIGYEIFIRSFNESDLFADHKPYCIGSRSFFDYYQKLLGTSLRYQTVHEKGSGDVDFYFYDIDEEPLAIDSHETVSPSLDGRIALLSIDKAAKLVTYGDFLSVATLPVSKEHINLHDPEFKGHTEYFQKKWNESSVFMTFVSEKINLLLLTTHIPLNEVAGSITADVLKSGIETAIRLKNQLGIKGKAGLLGLNPHSGENGLIGKEELGWKPVIDLFKDELIGPIPADTAFTSYNIGRCSIWIACYHDQGLIPFKMLAFDDGVNLSYGMKHIRTSVDHGTAAALIGKKTAGIKSFENAYRLAYKLSSNEAV